VQRRTGLAVESNWRMTDDRSPDAPRLVACPTCANPVEWSARSRYRPFCSERCKLIDLGAWATERYRVPDDPSDPENANNER
jgi:endogenous inhibitor of DNA gyrase (YacG/DUF329 family)